MTVPACSAARVPPGGQSAAHGRHRTSPFRRRCARELSKIRRPPTSRRPALCGPSVAAIRGGLPRPASRTPSHRGRAFSSCLRICATDGIWRRGPQSDPPPHCRSRGTRRQATLWEAVGSANGSTCSTIKRRKPDGCRQRNSKISSRTSRCPAPRLCVCVLLLLSRIAPRTAGRPLDTVSRNPPRPRWWP